jgi:hypothetical protein
MDVSYQLHTLVAVSLGERTPCSYWIEEREGHGNRSDALEKIKLSPTVNRTTIRGFPHRNFGSKRGGDSDNCDNDVEKKVKVE